MSIPLRVLIVDDSEDDTFLLLRELRRIGYDPAHLRVDSPPALEAALANHTWDIVLSDYFMPQFEPLEPLRVLHATGLDLPFIVISGRIGEDVAVAAMKAGAHDYLLKDNLARLGPAIERERREAANRQRRRRLESQKEDFLSIASHELKTPVTAIMGMAYLLLRRADQDGTPDREQRAIRVIMQQSERLSRLISELLDLPRIDQQRLVLKLQPVDLRSLAVQVSTQVALLSDRHELRIMPGPAINVRADPGRLEQVLLNLLENGIKYSPHGGVINVQLGSTSSIGWLEVSDPGIGIPAEDVPFVFERFYRAENVDLNSAGLGLGLYLAREILNQHLGTISVDSTLGQGSRFRIELPLAEAAPQALTA